MTVSDASFSEVANATTLNPKAKISSDMSPNTRINQSNFTIHTKFAVSAAYGENLAEYG